jgi:hypothetical protein
MSEHTHDAAPVWAQTAAVAGDVAMLAGAGRVKIEAEPKIEAA